MRISDWSSDVCSSDLSRARQHTRGAEAQEGVVGEFDRQVQAGQEVGIGRAVGDRRRLHLSADELRIEARRRLDGVDDLDADIAANGGAARVVVELGQSGRASCRERVCQYVYISEVPVSLK